MKCDELKEVMNVMQVSGERIPSGYYKKSEVDEAITELKAKLEDVQSSMYADVVDANMEVRRLKRALYKACANWAYATENLAANFLDVDEAKKWTAVYARCIKKAEEHK